MAGQIEQNLKIAGALTKTKNNAKLIEFSTNGISEMVIEVYYHLSIITLFILIIVIKWQEEKLHIK